MLLSRARSLFLSFLILVAGFLAILSSSPVFSFVLLELVSLFLLLIPYFRGSSFPRSLATYAVPNGAGSLLFLFSFIADSASVLGLIGLILKLGIFPLSF